MHAGRGAGVLGCWGAGVLRGASRSQRWRGVRLGGVARWRVWGAAEDGGGGGFQVRWCWAGGAGGDAGRAGRRTGRPGEPPRWRLASRLIL